MRCLQLEMAKVKLPSLGMREVRVPIPRYRKRNEVLQQLQKSRYLSDLRKLKLENEKESDIRDNGLGLV